MGAIRLIQEHLPGTRLIAVKSEELYASMADWTGEKGLGDGLSALKIEVETVVGFTLADPMKFLQHANRGVAESALLIECSTRGPKAQKPS